MMSQREREIVNVLNIRTLIQILVFAGFWLPFLFNWAWLLSDFKTSAIYGLLIGLGSIGLLYVPWKQNTARLKRLQKYEILFSRFFEAMITDMEANDTEKGNSWLTMDMARLTKMAGAHISGSRFSKGPTRALVKLSNYCAMIYLRRKELT